MSRIVNYSQIEAVWGRPMDPLSMDSLTIHHWVLPLKYALHSTYLVTRDDPRQVKHRVPFDGDYVIREFKDYSLLNAPEWIDRLVIFPYPIRVHTHYLGYLCSDESLSRRIR